MLTSDAADLAAIMLKAAHSYTVRGIAYDKDAEYYSKTMSHCVYLCDVKVYGTNLYIFHRNLVEYKKFVERSHKKEPSILCNSKRYTLLACEQAIDAVESLIRRFITGGSDPDATFLRFLGAL